MEVELMVLIPNDYFLGQYPDSDEEESTRVECSQQ